MMPWVEMEMPLFPRTRRTADGTYYEHDGTGHVRVRSHHVAELLRGQGVRRAVVPESASAPVREAANAPRTMRRR